MTVRAHRVLTHPNLTRLNRSDLLVLCRLLAHLHEQTGEARPGIETLTKQTGLAERTVQRAIRRIEAAGIMQVRVGGGRSRANVYHFTNPVIHADTVSSDKPRHINDRVTKRKPRQSDAETPSIQSINPVTLVTPERRNGENGEENARDNGKHRTDDRPDSEHDTPKAEPDGKQTAFTFQTTTGPWTLTEGQRNDLRGRFPFIHVDTELAGLAEWTEANPNRRKKPGAMHGWLRARLAQKQTERPLETPAYYGDGFTHKSLPTDPTPDELAELLADD